MKSIRNAEENAASGKGKTSQDLRRQLAAKALARRMVLSMSRSELVRKTGISDSVLTQYEALLPEKTAKDDVWEDALRVPRGWLRDPDAVINPAGGSLRYSRSEGATVLDDMRDIFTWFVRDDPQYRTNDRTLLSEAEKRTVEMLMQRYGAAGEAASLTQVIAEQAGVSRERVRVLITPVISNCQSSRLVSNAVKRLLGEIKPLLPARVSEIDAKFSAILGEGLSVEGAQRFAEDILRLPALVHTTPRSFGWPGEDRILMPGSGVDEEQVRAVLSAAANAIRLAGSCRINTLASFAASTFDVRLSAAVLRNLCVLHPGFEWLDEASGWFWFGKDFDSRVKNAAMKVVCVASRPVATHEFLTAVRRIKVGVANDMLGSICELPPHAVLSEMLARFDNIKQVRVGVFQFDGALADATVAAYLTPAEFHVYKAIKNHGGAMLRRLLADATVHADGIAIPTLNIILDSSPIIVRVDTAVWGLIGNHVSKEALRGAILAEHDIADSGDGWVELDAVIPATAMIGNAWMVPNPIALHATEGEYAVEGASSPANFVKRKDGALALRQFTNKLSRGLPRTATRIRLGINQGERRLRIVKVYGPEAELTGKAPA